MLLTSSERSRNPLWPSRVHGKIRADWPRGRRTQSLWSWTVGLTGDIAELLRDPSESLHDVAPVITSIFAS